MAKQNPNLHKGNCFRVTYPNATVRRFVFLGTEDSGETWIVIEEGQHEPKKAERDEIWPKGGAYYELIKPSEMNRPSADDVAKWMWDAIQQQKSLEQNWTAQHIERHFGAEFVTPTEYGGLSIDSRVRNRFNKMHDGAVGYEGGGNGEWSIV